MNISSSTSLKETELIGNGSFGKLSWPYLAFIFVLAAVIRLWFNFSTQHSDIAYSSDAAEYLRYAQALHGLDFLSAGFWLKAITNLFLPASHQSTLSALPNAWQNLNGFTISGPIFPLFLLLSCIITGTSCDINNWMAPVAAQSLLSAFTCVLIAFIATYSWNKKVGLIAGLIAACYPGSIVNSGRLYSESFACFLLCLIMCLVVRGFVFKTKPWIVFLTGLSMMSLQLTRSIMFMLSLALIPIVYVQHRGRRPWLALVMLFVGYVSIALPWLAFQQLASGQHNLIIDRAGHYNFFVGNNVDTQGWLSYPYPDLSGVEQKSFWQIAKESFHKSPSRYFKLWLDKPIRLFKLSWNDFRTPIGALDAYGQNWIHQIILLLACLGLTFNFFVQRFAPANRSQMLSRLFLFALLVFQCVYMTFITVPRYNLTIIPGIICFAAAGIISLCQLPKVGKDSWLIVTMFFAILIFLAGQKFNSYPLVLQVLGTQHVYPALFTIILIKTFSVLLLFYAIWRVIDGLQGNLLAAKACAILLTIFLLPSLCLPLRAHGRWWERTCPLHAGQKITQFIDLPQNYLADLRKRQCYLMINADGAAELNNQMSIKINGLPIQVMLIPNIPFLQDITLMNTQNKDHLFLECEYIFECLTYAAGMTNLDLRQWFLIPIPLSIWQKQLANQPMKIEIEKTGGQTTTLFGAYRTNNNYREIPSPTLCSWEKAFYGVENDHSFSDTSFDTKIAMDKDSYQLKHKDLLLKPRLQNSDYDIRLLVAPSIRQSKSSFITPLADWSLVGNDQRKLSLANSSKVDNGFRITKFPKYAKSDLWLVNLSGKIHSNKSPVNSAMRVIVHSVDANGITYSYDTPWVPRRIRSSDQNIEFNVAFPLAPAALPGKLKDLEIILPAQSAITSTLSNQSNALLDRLSIKIESMPTLPIGFGHYIL